MSAARAGPQVPPPCPQAQAVPLDVGVYKLDTHSFALPQLFTAAGRAGAAKSYIHELVLPDFRAVDDPVRSQVMAQLTSGLITAGPLRLLSYTHRISPRALVGRRRALKAELASPLGHRLIEEELYRLEMLLRTAETRVMRHLLITWGRPLRTFPHWLRPVTREVLSGLAPLARGRYAQHLEYLQPLTAPRPGELPRYVKLIGTYSFRPVVWSWEDPWGALIGEAEGPQIVCLDVRPGSEPEVRRLKEALKNLAQASGGRDDEAVENMRLAQAALVSREPLFKLRVFMLLHDSRLDRLLDRAQKIRQAFGSTLDFSLLEGQQLAALRFMGDAPDPPLPTSGHHIVLGSALPVAVGGLAGMVSTLRPDGMFVGVRLETGAPVYWRDFQKRDAGHYLILGKTGRGKSVFQGALLNRLHGMYNAAVVHIEPLGVSAKLRDLLRAEGAPDVHFHQLNWSTTAINPLTWVGGIASDSLREQQDHVIGILSTMLARPADRPLDNIDTGNLSAALERVYAGLPPDELAAHPERTPRLEALCQALRDLRDEQADYVARELASNFVDGRYGAIFNRQTSIGSPSGFCSGVDIYDTSGIAGQDQLNSFGQRLRTIFYYVLIRMVFRAARKDMERELAGSGCRAVPRVFSLDELYVLLRDPFLASAVTQGIKTARNWRMKFVVVEQDLRALTGPALAQVAGDGGLQLSAGQAVLNQVDRVILFGQGEQEAQLAREVYGQRLPQHVVEFLLGAQTAQFAALVDGGSAYCLQNVLLGSEYRYLVGDQE